MKFKTHISQFYQKICILAFVIIAFYIIAIFMAPAKEFTAYYYLKIFLPIGIIMALYLKMFQGSSEIEITNNSIILYMKYGRNRETIIPFKEISEITSSDFFYSLFGASHIVVTSESSEYLNKCVLINHYLIFKKEEAEKIIAFIKQQ